MRAGHTANVDTQDWIMVWSTI